MRPLRAVRAMGTPFSTLRVPATRAWLQSSRLKSQAGTAIKTESVDAGVVRDPVDLPALAAIGREGLLEVACIGLDGGDHESHQDGPAGEAFLIVELRNTVPEFTLRGCTHGTPRAVGKIQAPLMRLRVVEPQGQRLDVAFGTVHLEFH